MLNLVDKRKNIILLGPPGCGKGTQGNMIVDSFKYYRLSTGDLLRSISSNHSESNLELRMLLNSGAFVSDQVVNKLVEAFYFNNPEKKLILLDGFPRNIDQAKFLDELLASINSKIDIVFKFNIDNETLIKRVTGRLICRSCGAIYNCNFLSPMKAGICDHCGSNELNSREDDKVDVLKARLAIYRDFEQNFINFYQNRIVEIDAKHSPEVIFNKITAVINELDTLNKTN